MTLTKEQELRFYTLNIKELTKQKNKDIKTHEKKQEEFKKQIEEQKEKKQKLTEEIKSQKIKK